MKTISEIQVKRYIESPLEFFYDLLIPTSIGIRRLGDVWAPFQKEMFEAISPSLRAVALGKRGPYRGFWLERTKGGSKDSDVGNCLLWLLLFSPRPLLMEAGADDQDQAQETHRAMRECVKLNPWMMKRVEMRASKVLCQSTGSELNFLTTSRTGDGTHGSRPAVTICNELSHVMAKGFIQTMLDNADKVTTNLRIICTNAGVRDSWQHAWRENYRQDPRWFFQKLSEPAPWVDEEALADAKFRNTQSRYLRLWGGIWAAGGGDAIDEKDIIRACNRKHPMTGKEDGYIFVSGLDLGVKHDHSALVTLGCRMGTGRVRLASCRSWKPGKDGHVDLMEVQQAVVDEHRKFKLAGVWYDPSQAILMAQQLKKAGVNACEMPFTPKNCDMMARDLLSAFRTGSIDMHEDKELIADIHRLSIIERKWGYKLDATSDDTGHADRATALVIALPVALEVAGYEFETEEESADSPYYEGATV